MDHFKTLPWINSMLMGTEVLDSHKSACQEIVISKLNPILRGWANYHKHIVSGRVFQLLNEKIWQCLWQWARRRHRNKGRRWIFKRYFKHLKGRYRFSAECWDDEGRKYELTLYILPETRIVRHVQLQAHRNPYDPDDKDYFKERQERKMKKKLEPHKRKSVVYRRQKGICEVCKQPLLAEDELDQHHLISRQDGGCDVSENLMLLHPNCHRQIHALS